MHVPLYYFISLVGLWDFSLGKANCLYQLLIVHVIY